MRATLPDGLREWTDAMEEKDRRPALRIMRDDADGMKKCPYVVLAHLAAAVTPRPDGV